MRNARVTQLLGCAALMIAGLAALPAAACDRDRRADVRYERRVYDVYDRDSRCEVRDEYRVTRRYVRDRDVAYHRDLCDDWRNSADYRERSCDRAPRRVEREVVYRHVPPVVREREVVVERPVVVEKPVVRTVTKTVTKVVRVPATPAKVAGSRQTRKPAY